jgi:Amt family ammonium transporter
MEGYLMRIDTGDTAWLLISTALVMLMTPALSLFYGGMVRSKNILGTLMQSFVSLGVISILWVVYGYSLSFGPDVHHFIGNLDWAMLNHVGLEPYPIYSATIPHQLFMLYQMMFAVITPALITGAFAERFKFKTFLVFIVAWFTFVYCPIAHWIWGQGGWIKELGGLDFAGGMVVHIASGMSALIATLMIGKRIGWKRDHMSPHNLSLTILGASLLWFGWFGFNAGSALGANALAVKAFLTTQLAAAAGAVGWLIIEWKRSGRPTTLGIASGAIAGLVSITPAAGFIYPMWAIVIGFIGGIGCYGAVRTKTKLNIDDSLDAVGIHGIGGIWGSIATGIFATTGLVSGSWHLLKIQLVSTLAAIIYSLIMTFVIIHILAKTMGVRVTKSQEVLGLDISQHGERGYNMLEVN